MQKRFEGFNSQLIVAGNLSNLGLNARVSVQAPQISIQAPVTPEQGGNPVKAITHPTKPPTNDDTLVWWLELIKEETIPQRWNQELIIVKRDFHEGSKLLLVGTIVLAGILYYKLT